VSYFGCYIALNSLGGNIYFNLFFSTILELNGNLSAVYFIKKNYDLKKVIINCLYIIGVAYVCCIFTGTSLIGQ